MRGGIAGVGAGLPNDIPLPPRTPTARVSCASIHRASKLRKHSSSSYSTEIQRTVIPEAAVRERLAWTPQPAPVADQ